MKKLLLFISALIITCSSWAQSPEKLSYQAVIRNAEGELVKNQEVGIQISLLIGSIYGASAYVEKQNATTNANGLLSIEIGSEEATVLFGVFAEIDWSADKYLIKTETDPAGGTDYSITGTSQLLSVPYALYAKTAETVTGGIAETDPTYTESQAANITATDIENLGNLSGVNTGDQDLAPYAKTVDLEPYAKTVDLASYAKIVDLADFASKTALIDSIVAVRADIGTGGGSGTGIETELDPVFSASEAANITADHITVLGLTAGTNTGDQDLTPYAKKVDVLALDNSTAFTPDADYEPATKKYVDSKVDSTYEVGDYAFGGIVFWVDETGKKGLVCATADQSSALRWKGDTASVVTGAMGDGPYAGQMNTSIIVAFTSVLGFDGADYAALLCSKLKTTGTKSYGDWYLPSKEELKLMFTNKAVIDAASAAAGGSAFSTDSYWSSTEVNNNVAQAVDFSGGTDSPDVKSSTHGVRAVRAF